MHKRLFGILRPRRHDRGGLWRCHNQLGAPRRRPGLLHRLQRQRRGTVRSSAAAGAQTLNFAIDSDLSGGLTNAADNVPTAQAIQFLYDALYDLRRVAQPVSRASRRASPTSARTARSGPSSSRTASSSATARR